MMHLTTLGALDLRDSEETALASVLSQPKRLALLVYLALARPRGFQRRDTLLGLFWPDADYERARGALNQAIYYLRRSLGPDVVVNRGDDEVGLDTALLSCDAVEFEGAIERGDSRGGLELYRGDLLPGFFIQGAPAWEHWLDAERARLRGTAAEAAWTLADRLVDAADATEAVHWARRAVALAPDDEVELRRLVALLERAGDRAGAVQAFEEAAARFDREYEIRLSAETLDLIRRVRSDPAVADSVTGTETGDDSDSPASRNRASGAPQLDAPVAAEAPGGPVFPSATPVGSAHALEPARNPDRGAVVGFLRRRRVVALIGAAAVLTAAILIASDVVRSSASSAGDSAEPLEITAPAAVHRLAVLPLAHLGGQPDERYLADGMTEELITRLSRLSGLRVIASTSAMTFRDTSRSAADIGRKLNVRYLLRGSVQSVDGRIRTTIRLVDSTNEENLWTGSFDADLVDLLDVQREIAERVADALSFRLHSAERDRLARRDTDRPEARRAYLRGRYLLGRADAASLLRARDYFAQALEIDPAYALAWSGLSDAWEQIGGSLTVSSAEAYPRARSAAERALSIDPELGAAHASLAMALTYYYWDSESAEHHFRRAIELEPGGAHARRTYAGHLRNLGRFEEALAHAEAARDLDPIPYFSHFELIVIPYFQRRYDVAVARADSLVALDPAYGEANFLRALALVQKRQWADALSALDEFDPRHDSSDAGALRAHILAKIGRPEEARRYLAGNVTGISLDGFQKAIVHIGLGETDLALESLDRAYEARSYRMRLLGYEPLFDPLRADRRFQDLLRGVGLAGPDGLVRDPRVR